MEASRARELVVGIRPQDIELDATGNLQSSPEGAVAAPEFHSREAADAVSGTGSWVGALGGRATLTEPLGAGNLVHIECGSATLRALVSGSQWVQVGDGVSLRLRADRLHLFRRETGARVEGAP